ncbi:hypothetical protein CLV98_10874 [Dyadobacter jejuensis]|uniref:Uncharacterized protein n=1 Tax=Dyadobacter jejuensis TaxID=1082580 RepID=A0A316AJK0_9BACT|nr:hypothetical protein [Dyadobacter jejuensis]PWJ57154.1 hypothetical protein CLV98_10874 [Dyadobacter jejuensis]
MPKYTGKEGKLLPAKQIKSLLEGHKKQREDQESRGHHFIESEFFGLETFKHMLEKCGGNPVGFKVYYGNQLENREGKEPMPDVNGRPTSRIIIVPVDADGNNLMGGKTLPGHKDADDDGEAMGDGPTCPHYC